MPLSPAEIQQLSRLLDEALALPAPAREAWLLALPEAVAPLLPHLRLALAAGSHPSLTLPVLGAEGEGSAGETVGAHRLLREIGRGGMGSVWLAERADGIFQRRVAIKLPRVDRHPGLAARMAREREIGALLEHRHIARLYDAGADERGRPYLVMEHVDGEPITEHVRLARPGRDDTLRLLLQVCAAVAHAHRHLVVHRDLKPGNILVDTSGQVKLLDFGVARRLDDTAAGGAAPGSSGATPSDLRQTFTPRYAAPEQKAGGVVSTATDLYALGLIAHELLAGQVPGEAGVDAAALGPELAAVLRRATAADPAARHGSADALARDLQAVLEGRVPDGVRARPWRRVRLWLRRQRTPATLGALLLLALAGGGGALAWQQAEAAQLQARLDRARLFLMSTLADAELPSGALPGAAALIGATAGRARRELAQQPVLQAEVLGQLGAVQGALGDRSAAGALLAEAHGLMQQHAGPQDPGRAQVAALLAGHWVGTGEPGLREPARALAQQALARCAAPRRAVRERCGRARAWAHGALRNLAVWRNEHGAAAEQGRLAFEAAAAAMGAQHPESTALRVHLATVLRGGQRYAEAAAELAQAASAAAAAPLKASDAQQLQVLQALLANDLGRHAEALKSLQPLLDPARSALPLRLQALAHLALGQLPEALAAGERAAALAGRQSAAWELAFAWQLRARALAALGRESEAAAALAHARSSLRALGFDETSAHGHRLLRVAAELALRAGRAAEAAQLLQPLQAEALPPVERAQLLDQRAAALRLQGRAAEALPLHQHAAEALRGVLPAGHPLLLRNRVEQALARRLAQGPGAAPELAAAASAYLEQLPADSAWRRTVLAFVADPAAGLTQTL